MAEKQTVKAPLTALESLDNVEGGSFAIRNLNKDHVEQLALSNEKEWPPIIITQYNGKTIIIDGYHRAEAARIKNMPNIIAIVETYNTTNDMIEAAFRANLKHGLKASNETRSDYAYWLSLTHPELTQSQIAARIGISQAAVSKAIAKREAEIQSSAEDEDEEITVDLKRESKKFIKSAIKFASLLVDERDANDLATYIKTAEDKDEIQKLINVLQAAITPVRRTKKK